MKNEGWTLSELAGELRERGIDIENIADNEIYSVLDILRPENAAEEIARRGRSW